MYFNRNHSLMLEDLLELFSYNIYFIPKLGQNKYLIGQN